MKLITSLEDIHTPYNNAVVTIGNFDGVHIGHRGLLTSVMEKAKAINGTSVVFTFESHSSRALKQNGHPPLITLYEQKIELISALGVDVLICIPFTRAIRSISADMFVKEILLERIGMKAIAAGKDFAFGKNREGDLSFLKENADRYGFEVIVSDWVEIADRDGQRISSTRIRKLVMAGDVSDAKGMLGRYYQIRGVVEAGRDRGGRLLGFPTANVKLTDELCPKTGVYAVTVECLGHRYRGVANIGYSPTFEDQQFTVEIHILDFDQDIYGEDIRVNFVSRIRQEQKFANVDALIAQIKKDVSVAVDVLSAFEN